MYYNYHAWNMERIRKGEWSALSFSKGSSRSSCNSAPSRSAGQSVSIVCGDTRKF